MATALMILTLWIACGLLAILIYPHTPGKTDIRHELDVVAITFLWPFMLAAAYEVRSQCDLKAKRLRRNEFFARSFNDDA